MTLTLSLSRKRAEGIRDWRNSRGCSVSIKLVENVATIMKEQIHEYI